MVMMCATFDLATLASGEGFGAAIAGKAIKAPSSSTFKLRFKRILLC
tara:strand:- start:312 stop:452 length:141 start_codon:yes stop_codon:yes gene_type:complete